MKDWNKEFNIGFLIETNQHLELLQKIKNKLFATYEVVAIFTWMGYNGESIDVNRETLIWRRDKFGDFKVKKGVEVLEHNLSHKQGGSNRHPSIAWGKAKVKLKFMSEGLPRIDRVNGWKMKIESINEIRG